MQEYSSNNIDLNDPEIVSTLDEVPLWSAAFGQKLLDSVDYHTNIKVLDIGSGTGFPMLELAQRLGNSCQVYGIDPWEAAVDRIKLKMKNYSISNVEIHLGKAEQMPFESDFFDLIISNNGINNVQDLDKVLSECRRTGKPGCQFYQTFNLPDSMHEFYDTLKKVLAKNELDELADKVDEHIHSKRKSVNFMNNKLEDFGFAVQGVEIGSFKYRFANADALFNHYFIRVAFLGSWLELVPEQDRARIFKKISIEMDKKTVELTIPFALIKSIKNN
jgi:arsenite methyltransferase